MIVPNAPSPLLSNILLDDLDKELERRRLRFVRYADDFMIFVKSRRSAVRVFGSVQRFLTRRLRLVVNEQKSRVGPALGCEFLGLTFVGSRVTIQVAPKKLIAFKRRTKELTGRSRGISMERRLTDLNRYVRGWIGYFGLARQFGTGGTNRVDRRHLARCPLDRRHDSSRDTRRREIQFAGAGA